MEEYKKDNLTSHVSNNESLSRKIDFKNIRLICIKMLMYS